MKKAYRTVHYYELSLDNHEEVILTRPECLIQVFAVIHNMAAHREPDRYQTLGGKLIFIQEVEINLPENTIRGKLRSIRDDIKPEVLDMITDTARGIETAENEGIVETSHFIIDISRPRARPLLAFEFNQSGGRVNDLLNYLIKIGTDQNLIVGGVTVPIGRGSLDRTLERIQKCSEIVIKVHKEDIDRIQALDQGTYEMLDTIQQACQSEYVTIDLKYDYRSRENTREGNSLVERLVGGFTRRPDLAEAFKVLKVTAEDSEKGGLLDTFDLLIDKQTSRLHVELKEGYSTVVSADIYEKISQEIIRKRLLN